MLVCPQCQFENPNTNKFCQKCGTSLTHKACQECGTQIPVNAETCLNCGAFTGIVWQAIISKGLNSLVSPTSTQEPSLDVQEEVGSEALLPQMSQLQESVDTTREPSQPVMPPGEILASSSASNWLPIEEDSTSAASSQVPEPRPEEKSLDKDIMQPLGSERQSNVPEQASEANRSTEASSTPSVVYLDPQHRYRLLEPLKIEKTAADGKTVYSASVRVLDCQPFQQSPLEALIEQQQNVPQAVERSESREENYNLSPLSSDTWNILGIPAIAQPYLALRDRYSPTLPNVHDAWEREEEAIVLLEDRSEWQTLSDLWGSEQFSPLQILYWLDEMAKLWEALEPWHCRQSLLEISNVRLDEDQSLALVRLYPETQEAKLTLQDLGQMWQQLFNQSDRTHFTSLAVVFQQMCTNEIETIAELRSHLTEIAREQQSTVSGASSSPDSGPDESTTANPIQQAEDSEADPIPPFALSDLSSSNEGDVPTVILPMQLLSLDDAGSTDIGRLRDHNEDFFGVQMEVKKQENPLGRTVQARGLYILCDGMGGHAAGEVASMMAVDTLKRYFRDNWHDQLPTEDTIREAVRLANQAIYDVNQQNARSGSGRMGTTLVMLLIQNTNAAIAHVGDSRLYRLTRKQGLEQLTIDHEVGQREINRGVDAAIAYSRPDAYQLTQALGPRGEQFINPDIEFLEINEDTLFLLCSDGLSDNDLLEAHWQTHLAPLLSSRANLDQGILQLIELGNEHNGHDNITALLIRVKVRPNFEQQQQI